MIQTPSHELGENPPDPVPTVNWEPGQALDFEYRSDEVQTAAAVADLLNSTVLGGWDLAGLTSSPGGYMVVLKRIKPRQQRPRQVGFVG